jgi:tetratricopeptide (TPR) repeat protein
MKKLLIVTLIIVTASEIYCQTDKELALDKKNRAVELMDNGSPDESIIILEEAKKLDPGTNIYDYEIGYAYVIKKDYPRALKVFKKVVKYKDADDQCYQMLGNIYDYNGDPENALKAYDRGLKKFPDSGRLYLEKGTVYLIQEKYNEALPFYEQGIKADPAFASNYYRAARLLCNSNEQVWGMIYGEIFLNLEPDTKRTKEISKLLFDTYKSQIVFTSDTSFTVSFSKNAAINLTIDDLTHFNDFKLPFGSLIYEPTLMLSIIREKKIDLNSLDRIRQQFVANYYEKKLNIKYPNVLFDFQKTLKDSGFFQPYNYWLLSSGEPESFDSWKVDNAETWDKFVDWFNNNRLSLSKENKFSRDQY